MSFIPMDPSLIQELLKDETDVITPFAEMDREIYKQARCPVCGHTGADRVLLPPKIIQTQEDDMVIIRPPFSDHSPTPQGVARCPTCATLYSARTGVIVQQDEPVITDITGGSG